MNLRINIGSRQSPLAQAQVKEVLGLLKTPVAHQLIQFSTRGDEDKTTSLTSLPAEDFFTNTLDQALLEGKIDIAIHSAKDLPKTLPAGLHIVALTAANDETDAWVGNSALNVLPNGTRIGTSSLLRQSQIKQLYPNAVCVDIRGTINERLECLKKGEVDGLVIAACALKWLGLAHLIKDIFPWEAAALQGQLAVVARAGDAHIKELFYSIDVRQHYGTVSLVGAGPGALDLITLRGIEVLEKATCVFYDFLVDEGLLKYAPLAEHIYAGKRKGEHSISQNKLNAMLKDKARQGFNVVRLKGGDPLIFGRGADEINYLSAYHIPVSVVPGISSATGIPSSLKVPLTARGVSSSVAFISAHDEHEGAQTISQMAIPKAQTIVFLMGITKLPQIIQNLKEQGWSSHTPMMIISKGTRWDERIVKGDLTTIEGLVNAAQLQAPALIIAGDVTNFYKEKEQKIYLHAGQHPQYYSHLGRIISWPMIDIKPVAFTTANYQQLVSDIYRADIILLTSPNAVKYFMSAALKVKTIEQIRRKIIAVIGKHTGLLLQEFHINPHIMASEETAKGLFTTLTTLFDIKRKVFLLPRSSMPNPFLKEALIQQGAQVIEWTIYNNIKPAYRPLPNADISGIIFTSPSTVTNFIADYTAIPADWEILAKGPVTYETLNQAGYAYAKSLPSS